MLRLIAELGIADKVPTDGHVTVQELATRLRRAERAVAFASSDTRLLKNLKLNADGRVPHTPRSRLLRHRHTKTVGTIPPASGPRSVHGMLVANLDVARTGGIPHEAAWDRDRFTYLRQHPDEARIFDAMMANFPDNPACCHRRRV